MAIFLLKNLPALFFISITFAFSSSIRALPCTSLHSRISICTSYSDYTAFFLSIDFKFGKKGHKAYIICNCILAFLKKDPA
ncbi:unknown protein [Parachlamydia acanthamoebae UV-7]|uniref:Uncharacterized protein n=2 Tax=Parachlamydia acanthamoebae TaxID=83552 RepID=F8KVL6_PARAV|nr:hypothetical protein DB43_AK00140 [Parachlamydia acanthamoebae]CCB85152.1 unknown protein [Parachlamydia acanthamoebae UV-7]